MKGTGVGNGSQVKRWMLSEVPSVGDGRHSWPVMLLIKTYIYTITGLLCRPFSFHCTSRLAMENAKYSG